MSILIVSKKIFFSGFMELNALSLIYKSQIFILDDLYYNNEKYFNKISVFNNIDKQINNLEDIIYINFINKDFYQILILNKNFICRYNKNQKLIKR